MITGYKWTERKTDKKLFIVTLLCNNEFIDEDEGRKLDKVTFYANNKSFYTTDCVVKRIEDEEGNTVDIVDGQAFIPFVYYVGQEIKGKRIFYMHDREYLITYAGKHWIPATHRLTEILDKWNQAGDNAIKDPLLLLSPDLFNSLRERYFFDLGGTIEDLHILVMEGDILRY